MDSNREIRMPKWDMNEDIVVSGVSGRFPESDTIDELRDNLYNHVDMITEDDRRWPLGRDTRNRELKLLTFQYTQVYMVCQQEVEK